jgi:hypothetical protein
MIRLFFPTASSRRLLREERGEVRDAGRLRQLPRRFLQRRAPRRAGHGGDDGVEPGVKLVVREGVFRIAADDAVTAR